MQSTANVSHGRIQAGSSSLARTRNRNGLAAALTLFAVAFGVVLVLAFGIAALPFYAISVAVPLVLLWLSADVYRADER